VDTMITRGVSLHFIKENLTFSGNDDPFSKLTLSIAGAFASFERDIIKSRQAEGIAKAKERGVYTNRKRKSTINVKRVKGLRDEGLNNTEIAAHMGISRMSVYRSLNGRL
jgi:DNA invertase Pin-like site-specific DNA recombinase